MYGTYSYGYGSDDEYIMKRRIAPGKYSREDFKEQYCINEKSLDQLDRSRSSLGLFGCLSSYQDSPCNKRHQNVFTSCYGRHPSDEHLSIVDSGVKRREWREAGSGEQSDGEGGFTPRPRSAIGWSGSARDIHYNRRYAWDEVTHSYVPISTASSTSGRSSTSRPPAQRYASAPLNQMSRKHVSFENSILNRSSTASSFEETKLRRAVMIIGGSVERLLEAGGRADACTGVAHKAVEATSSQTLLKRITRTQSTQTDTFIVRASGPPPYLSLSPRTSYRVRMVSQGAQTNGGLATPSTKIISKSMSTNINKLPKSGKKLTKTLSDGEILVEKKRATTPYIEVDLEETKKHVVEPAIVKHKLVDDDDCFHEGIIKRKLNHMIHSVSIDSSRDQTETFSSGESSSSGSYSLDFKQLTMKKVVPVVVPAVVPVSPVVVPPTIHPPQPVIPLPPVPLPDPPPNGAEEEEPLAPLELLSLLVRPPMEFCDEQPLPLGKKKKRQRKFRAKSEERFHRSDASTQSNISLSLRDLRGVSPGEIGEEEGVYSTPYDLGIWVYIGENEEAQVWKRHEPLLRSSSGDSTLSEKDFMKRYTAVTHRMVHRKASGETYRRLGENSLEITKRLQIHRAGGEFGFRIHGSRPVVVSAVEEGTPAEESGLEVGDVIMSINGVHVLESSHSDVVKLATGDVLELELSRTADVVKDREQSGVMGGPGGLMEGRLWKVARNGGWVERFFHLTPSSLYWYKNGSSTHPLGVLPITPEQTCLIKDLPQDPYHVFTLKRTNGGRIQLGSLDLQCYKEWTQCIAQLLNSEHEDTWLRKSYDNILLPPREISGPDCWGTLGKWWNRAWTRRHCVLKDACLYFYQGEESPVALSAAHLHGYRINIVATLGGKKYVFELIPPQATLRHYYLAAENEHDRKRWLAALEYSIDRWINVKK